MQQHPAILRCSHQTAFIAFLIIGSLFILTGCAQLYKALGLTEEQIDEQVSEDQKVIIRTVTQVRTTTAEILTTAIAGLGTMAAGLLARLLGTERKITAAMITGIEAASDVTVKNAVKDKAMSAGVESKLNKRVASLT